MNHRLRFVRLGMAVAICMAAIALALPAAAATLCVGSGGSGCFSTIGAAVAGGLAQNLSFLFGMKALLLIAAVFYVGSALVNFTRPLPQVAE